MSYIIFNFSLTIKINKTKKQTTFVAQDNCGGWFTDHIVVLETTEYLLRSLGKAFLIKQSFDQ